MRFFGKTVLEDVVVASVASLPNCIVNVPLGFRSYGTNGLRFGVPAEKVALVRLFGCCRHVSRLEVEGLGASSIV